MHDPNYLISLRENLNNEWGDPVYSDDVRNDSPVDLVDPKDDTLLAEMCRQIAKTIQFPLSTVYAHALGCIAAAMNRSFYVSLRGSENPVNLYIVSSQPPSTGKSGVNGFLSDPIERAYNDYNKSKAPERAKLAKGIIALKKEVAQDEKTGNDQEVFDKCQTLEEMQSKLDKLPVYQPFFTNATPEALEQNAFKQLGVFNIVSDEAGSILSTLGITYGDSSKPANADMVLQGWDKNRLATIRVSREASTGRPRGVFAVLAQDETIESILAQGERGVGIAERFLICKEKNLLGSRNHLEDHFVDTRLTARYATLVNRLVYTDETTLKFNKSAELFIREEKQKIEPELGDFGKYGNNVMRGVLGKMDKQVYKIASILHASENFQDSVSNMTINLKTAKKAFAIYMKLTKVYIDTSDEKGFNGIESQIKSMTDYLQSFSETKRTLKIKFRRLMDNTKNTPAWKGQPKSTAHFRANIMPVLVKRNICKYANGSDTEILINPKL